MKTKTIKALSAVLLAGLIAAPIAFGTEITIYDGMNASSGSTWYTSTSEDQEVEPNMATGQKWDLEGFKLYGSSLKMIGGFNFVTGAVTPGYATEYSGDLFIDVNGDAKYGPGIVGAIPKNTVVNNTFGYDYVLDLDFRTLTYLVYAIDQTTQVLTVDENANTGSNPFLYVEGGNLIASGIIGYQTGLTDAQTGYLGGLHNVATVDLSFLAVGTEFTSHFTMGCGNDDLMGHGTTSVPEPGTMLLLGAGLIGLALFSRTRTTK